MTQCIKSGERGLVQEKSIAKFYSRCCKGFGSRNRRVEILIFIDRQNRHVISVAAAVSLTSGNSATLQELKRAALMYVPAKPHLVPRHRRVLHFTRLPFAISLGQIF